jgi:phenylacetate-CoA ligase
VKLFPSQIGDVLMQVEGVESHYRVILDEVGGAEHVEVQVEVSSALLTGDVRHLLRIQEQLRQRLLTDLGLTADLKLVEPSTIGPIEQPSQRIVDRRRPEGGSR